jgi:hypothetical protein
MEVSRVEQELTAKESKSEHFRMIWELLTNKNIGNYEKVKLVILFALR